MTPKVPPSTGTPRLAFTIDEAATSLGIGRTAFREHVLPDLRVVYIGRKPVIAIAELERHLERQARRMLAAELDQLTQRGT